MRIAVIGAGPAGSSAALALARGGIAVDLYRPRRPGEKPCGGAVPEHVLPRIAGFDPGPLPAVVSPRAIVENAAAGRVEIPLDGIRIFRRADLDRALADAAVAAGAGLVGDKAERLELGGGGVRITAGGLVRAYDWAIGADGARGLTRRTLGLPPTGDSVGLGASLAGLAVDRLVLSLPGVADAYLWIFPRPGGASVGIAYSPDRLSDGTARRVLDELLDRHVPGWRLRPGPRYRYPIPVFGAWTEPAVRQGVAGRVLLAGDAAALADPLTREGIRYGVLSGLWAAESLLAGHPEEYPVRLHGELAGELLRAERARGLFFDDAIGQWMVSVARWHPGIRRVARELLSGRQPYRGLRKTLLRAAVGLPSPHSRPLA